MNKYSEKYPNVLLTQGLIDLGNYNSAKLPESKKNLKVLAQLWDESEDLNLEENNAIGNEEDPWGSEDGGEGIPPEVQAYLDKNGIRMEDLMSSNISENAEPGLDDMPPTDGLNDISVGNSGDEQSGTWPEALKEFFDRL